MMGAELQTFYLFLFIEYRVDVAQNLQDLSYEACSTIIVRIFGLRLFIIVFGICAIIQYINSLLLCFEDYSDSFIMTGKSQRLKLCEFNFEVIDSITN